MQLLAARDYYFAKIRIRLIPLNVSVVDSRAGQKAYCL